MSVRKPSAPEEISPDPADSLPAAAPIRWAEILHWPAAAVMGHAGTLVAGRVKGRDVAVALGPRALLRRARPADGYLPVRVLGAIGWSRVGPGLGPAIAKHIAESAGPMQGATFTLTLPLAENPNTTTAGRPQATTSATEGTHSPAL